VDGRASTTSHGVVMDASTARKYHFKVGQRVRVLLAGSSRTFTITGIARFGAAANLAGATLAGFNLPTAQTILGEVARFNDIYVVASPGASKPAVERGIAQILPRGVDVVTRQTVVNEETTVIDQGLSFFSTALLIFAFIALFVGAFTILNTFSIVVGQRTRELALLRIIGASRGQVFRSVLLEAAILGLVSSLAGLGLGVLTAVGLEALLRGFGISFPSGHPVIVARTVIAALAVGTGVTILAAISPARRAMRISPVVAISDQQSGDVSLRRRFSWGAFIALLGTAALGVGLSLPAILLVGLGALSIFIGVAMLAPALSRPFASVIGRPLARILGVAGKLGRENSMRSPRRTAQTASALMIGLAVVSAVAVLGASMSRSATSSVDNAVSANLIISNRTSSPASVGFSAAVPKAASSVPGVASTDTVYGGTIMSGQFKFRHSLETLEAVSTRHLAGTVILRMTEGTPRALVSGSLFIDSTTAKSNHLSVGDTVPVRFALTGRSTMRIGGIYKPNPILGSYLVNDSFYISHYQNPLPTAVLLRTDGRATVQQGVERALAPYPNVRVQTRAQLEKSQLAQLDKLLGLVYALLALAVIIALIGIVNTLVLSVFERTHEIGLLRAVGMKRRQVRTMIRSESVILSIFGAIIGIVIGTGLGIALASSLSSKGITDIVVPTSSMVVFLVLSALLGLVAAGWPARRAARLDVLAAIAAE
jgi:putative ABC transport system permease protein